MKNDRVILASRNNNTVIEFERDERKGGGRIFSEASCEHEEGFSIRVSEHDLERLRCWLVTGVSPSTVDLVDPLPPIADAGTIVEQMLRNQQVTDLRSTPDQQASEGGA